MYFLIAENMLFEEAPDLPKYSSPGNKKSDYFISGTHSFYIRDMLNAKLLRRLHRRTELSDMLAEASANCGQH